uniref:Putative reverse transcriptase n=1 Tax=Ornithodoros turicata TaxID=34597 RepID=A0A2R5L921_9ACAR
MKVLTLNVRGIRQHRKQRMLGSLLASLQVDIAFLQETHFSSLQEAKNFAVRVGVKGHFSCGTSRSRGVAILVTPRFRGTVLRHSFDFEGRLVSVDVAINGRDRRLVSIYAPTDYQERNDFLRRVDPYLLGKRDVVLGGDFNCVVDEQYDRAGGTSRNQPWKSKELRRLLRARDLADAWNLIHGLTPGFTFSSQDRHVRLDRFYVSKSLSCGVQDCAVVQVGTSVQFFTDHRAVVLDLQDPVGFGPQPAPWRLNPSLLNDDRVVQDVQAYLESRIHEVTSLEWWDSVKDGARRILRKWGKELVAERRRDIHLLQVGLRGLLECGLGSREEATAYKELQAELSALLWRRARGWSLDASRPAHMRSAGPVQAALSEVQRSTPVRLERLVREDGTLATTLDDLVLTCGSHYATLFARESVDPSLWEEVCRQYEGLTSDQSSDLDLDVSVHELFQAARSMRKGKSPGPDGLPVEFYLRFWDILGPALRGVFLDAVERGTLPASSRRGYVKLLCKDGARADELSAWRPITLLNVDYKLFAKVLQQRVAQISTLIVSPAQACAVPERGIQQHLAALRDIFYWVADRQARAYIVSFDQEAAFDRVDHGFLFHVLHRAGFGERFQQFVRVLYTGAESQVLVNGRPSLAFDVTRGVRQGCPLSPTLYVLVFEAVVRMLSNQCAVPRLPVPGSHKFATVFAYADDLTVCLPTPHATAQVLNCLDKYSRASGAKLNERKCAFMAIGDNFPYSDAYGIPVRQSCRILGIEFHRTGPLTSNWRHALQDMSARIQAVSALDLDLRERAAVVSRHLCSPLWYFGTAFQPATATARRANRLTYQFFWNGRPERVQRALMMRPPQLGGWRFPDVRLFCAALGLSALFSVLRDATHISHHLALFFAGTYIQDFGGAFDIGRPHTERLMTFYRLMRKYAVLLRRHLPDVDFTTWSVRELYEALCEASFPVQAGPRPHDRSLVVSPFLEGSRVDILWQRSHEVLPVRARLHSFGLSRWDSCVTCGAVETHQHAFFDCINAAAMWRKVADLYQLPAVALDTTQFLDPVPVPERKRPAFVLLVAEVTFQLWCARTRAVYGAQPATLVDLLCACRIALRARLQDELRSFGLVNFRKRWKHHWNVFVLASGHIITKL